MRDRGALTIYSVTCFAFNFALHLQKHGFVSSCRMALGDWLVWGTIKPLLFEKQNEPSEASLLWLVGAQMVIIKSQLYMK